MDCDAAPGEVPDVERPDRATGDRAVRAVGCLAVAAAAAAGRGDDEACAAGAARFCGRAAAVAEEDPDAAEAAEAAAADGSRARLRAALGIAADTSSCCWMDGAGGRCPCFY